MSGYRAGLIFASTLLLSSMSMLATARAAGGAGGRLGYDPDPDQFIIGGQLILGRTLEFMQFTPSLDIGFGENLTSYAGNFDFRVIRLRPPKSAVALYGAIGPTVLVVDPDARGSQTDVGLTVAAGMLIPMGRTGHYVLEVRFGFGDVPDVRFIGGIGFGG